MTLTVKVKFRRSHEVVEITSDTVIQCREKAIQKVIETRHNVAHSDCTTEIVSGIPTAYVSQMVKPVTRRRMTSDKLAGFAERLGAEKTYNYSVLSYKWSEKQVNELREILKHEEVF